MKKIASLITREMDKMDKKDYGTVEKLSGDSFQGNQDIENANGGSQKLGSNMRKWKRKSEQMRTLSAVRVVSMMSVLILTILIFDSKRKGKQNSTGFSVSDVYISGQDDARASPEGPRRDLTWGKLNFIHTTDTHGWLEGHILEPNYSADWGDYVSFVSHMREKADALGVDLLVIDTGDKHDGNGLSDATEPDGEVSQRIFRVRSVVSTVDVQESWILTYQMADYDILTPGNHEFYRAENSIQELKLIRDHYGEKYLSSNIDLVHKNGTREPYANRYLEFETKVNHYRIMSFGFLFNFEGYNNRVVVKRVEEVVTESWFTEAIQKPGIDAFVIVSHIPIRWLEAHVIHRAIREYNPNTPIILFGGHSHIRDFTIYDEAAWGLESGRFLETIGWLSLDETSKSDNTALNVSRTYIDFNPRSLAHHADKALTPVNEFLTPFGKHISALIASYRRELKLIKVYGCVPNSFLAYRAPYPSDSSIFTLIENDVLPRLKRKSENPRAIMINTGSVRFDLFEGPYTRDSGYIISPFKNTWVYLPDVPLSLVHQVADYLNNKTYVLDLALTEVRSHITKCDSLIAKSETGGLEALTQQDAQFLISFCDIDNPLPMESFQQEAYEEEPENLTPGYVTHDDLGSDGDDTPHRAERYYMIPNVILAEDSIEDNQSIDEPKVDFVFFDFLERFVYEAIKNTAPNANTALEVKHYGGKRLGGLLKEHVVDQWSDCLK